MKVIVEHRRDGKREQIATAAKSLIGVDHGRQLLPLGVDQEPSRIQEFTLGSSTSR